MKHITLFKYSRLYGNPLSSNLVNLHPLINISALAKHQCQRRNATCNHNLEYQAPLPHFVIRHPPSLSAAITANSPEKSHQPSQSIAIGKYAQKNLGRYSIILQKRKIEGEAGERPPIVPAAVRNTWLQGIKTLAQDTAGRDCTLQL